MLSLFEVDEFMILPDQVFAGMTQFLQIYEIEGQNSRNKGFTCVVDWNL